MLLICMHRRYSAGMPSITVRNVPEATRDELAVRAAAAGWSLQEFLLHELRELARRPDPRVVVARARQRVAATGTRLSADEILGLRDEGRR